MAHFKKQKHTCLLITVLICVWMCGGCAGKEREVDYDLEQTEWTEEAGNPDSSQTTLSQFKDTKRWEDAWSVPLSNGTTVPVTVDARLILPELSEMSVVECRYEEFDSTFKEQVLKGIFQDTVVYDYDYAKRPVEQLPEAMEQMNQNIERLEEYLAYSFWGEEEKEQIKGWIEQAEQKLNDCKAALQSGSSEYAVAVDDTSDFYLSEIDGIWYVVHFAQSGYEIPFDGYREVQFYPLEEADVAPDEVSGHEVISYEQTTTKATANNRCSYSQEEAVALAQEALEAMGMQNQQFITSYGLEWTGGRREGEDVTVIETETIEDGYVLYFGVPIDDSVYADEMNGALVDLHNIRQESGISSTEQHTVVIVNSKGIIQMQIQNAFEIENVVENVSLLNLDSIKGIMTSAINELAPCYESMDVKNLTFKHLTLKYDCLQDEEDPDSFTYIPVWYLQEDTEGTYDVYVNALDGTIIKP